MLNIRHRTENGQHESPGESWHVPFHRPPRWVKEMCSTWVESESGGTAGSGWAGEGGDNIPTAGRCPWKDPWKLRKQDGVQDSLRGREAEREGSKVGRLTKRSDRALAEEGYLQGSSGPMQSPAQKQQAPSLFGGGDRRENNCQPSLSLRPSLR